ncbi:MAG: hypothetical protein CALGDGBN_02527 [Pseudomonadales bacterium]|nr:hypothetical protein [Pseudomonadales bacterium]
MNPTPANHDGMSAMIAPVLAAYREKRVEDNARTRWYYALPLLAVAVMMLAAHLLGGPPMPLGLNSAMGGYTLAFAYLAVVALGGVLGGRRPRLREPRAEQLLDDFWMALLMPGAGALATLDAANSDISAFTMICLPVAIFHRGPARSTIALQALGFACAATGILLRAPLDPFSRYMLLTVIGVSATVFAYIGIHFERTRRRAFVAAWELATRTATLEELNAHLEARSEELETANRRLEELAGTDPLTGVANRRQLFEAIEREFGRARRFGNQLALAVIDLDDFGPVNKRHGVLAGDEVLRDFAAALRGQVRGIDVVARYGGEEFVVVMPDCSAAAAVQLLERVRVHIAATPLSSRRIAITFSAGVAALNAEDFDPANLLHRADTALRRAKAGGKNRVEPG